MIKRNLLFSLLLLLTLWGCEEDNDPAGPSVQLGAAPVISSPSAGTTYALDETQAEEILANFAWSAADFGYQAAITYTVSIDAAGNNFANAVTIATTTGLAFEELTVGKINNILLARGLPFGFDNELEIQVCASVSDLVETLCSAALPIKINPYQAAVEYPELTVPGDYQGWDPADTDFAIFSRKSDDIYEGYIYFSVDSAVYKYAQGGSWATNWGDAELDGVLDPGGIDNNITIGRNGIGIYLLQCDLNTLNHSNSRTDWGILGDAVAGSEDINLVWDEARVVGDVTGVLTVTADLSAGSFRFRANDSWDLNFGDDFSNGTLEYDGEEIAIDEAGNYTIDLLLNVSDYTYVVTKN
ncbi:MAG: SusE domain-containing protein [Bacteroidota bacterium]